MRDDKFNEPRLPLRDINATGAGRCAFVASVPASKNLVEGVIPGELWTRQGSAAAATLIGSIAQTNTCRITRPTPPLHIHTSAEAVHRRARKPKKRLKKQEKKKKKRKVREGGPSVKREERERKRGEKEGAKIETSLFFH
jgi:hypothetical protein